ncbi:hypothetical protein [Paenibacillus xylaniclasticus]|uniref:hypothetical protein n=1 Tax=Paenibacillus xylaniclasticus TaxID=588083 RepID=UPI000FD86856|nr:MULTISPECIES: hypothetical protein [Paenibacillus]GFN29822.1 hypothetical protein PCURB6_00820 [Paenibacillus curdlanolyticus]
MANNRAANRGNKSAPEQSRDLWHDGRSDYEMDIDRMVNEGLGGGQVTVHNGLIDESTTDYMKSFEVDYLNDGEEG